MIAIAKPDELVPSYQDGMLDADHPLWEPAEQAYRDGFLSGAVKASQWLQPDRVDLDTAIEMRERVRNNHTVERDGLYFYVPGHEVLAARTRGRHHAMAFVEYMFERPDVRRHKYRAILESWVEKVEAWAAEKLDPEHVAVPPMPDEDWPEEPEPEPKPAIVKARQETPRTGNLAFLWNSTNPVIAPVESSAPPPPPEPPEFPMQTLRELVMRYPHLRPPVVHGLLREGETLNVIASPKVGKSWLVSDLALSVATGRPWLGIFPCEQGRVLLIDNELHKETSAHRIPKVMEARGITLADCGDRITVANLRGELKDIFGLGQCFTRIEPGQFKMVAVDAFYRAMPRDMDENDNGTMAQVYNVLDSYAAKLQCCFVLIHHSTKGNQSGKSVTDVGAGAGAQSRAADTHLVLRPHEEPGVAVLDAAVRSWPPIEPRCLRWSFPVWTVEDALNPEALKSEKPRRKSKPSPEPVAPTKPAWDAEKFAAAFVAAEPAVTLAIIARATKAGVPEGQAKKLLKLAEADGLVHRWKFGASQPVQFANRPQPEEQS
jgi:hypothetical protein